MRLVLLSYSSMPITTLGGTYLIPYKATKMEVHKLLVMQLQQKTACLELNVTMYMESLHMQLICIVR